MRCNIACADSLGQIIGQPGNVPAEQLRVILCGSFGSAELFTHVAGQVFGAFLISLKGFAFNVFFGIEINLVALDKLVYDLFRLSVAKLRHVAYIYATFHIKRHLHCFL